MVEERRGELYLGLIELLPSFQNLGIGTRLIRDLQKQAKAINRPLSLHVLKANDPARQLYQHLGFEIILEEEHRYKMTHWPSDLNSHQ